MKNIDLSPEKIADASLFIGCRACKYSYECASTAFDIFGLYNPKGNSSDIVLKSLAQICPFSSGVSTCFISYSLESKGICKGMTGSLGYLVSIKTGSVEELCDKILYTWECRENYTEQILQRVDEMKQYAYSAGFALSDLLAQ